MYTAVKKFLALHHHLSLPGIGSFTVETIPAKINIAERTLTSSINKINFSDEKLPAEKNFYSFLSQELNIDEVLAVRQFTHFIDELKSDLLTKKETVLKGIGKLTRVSANDINFYADELPAYFPELIADKIIRKNATHTVRVGEQEILSDMQTTLLAKEKIISGERWWIPALILAALGIAAIAYYYLVLHPLN